MLANNDFESFRYLFNIFVSCLKYQFLMVLMRTQTIPPFIFSFLTLLNIMFQSLSCLKYQFLMVLMRTQTIPPFIFSFLTLLNIMFQSLSCMSVKKSIIRRGKVREKPKHKRKRPAASN